MGALFAWPNELDFGNPDLAMTFVVPARDCNLKCSFCAIKKRGEAIRSTMRPEDYVTFLRDVAAHKATTIIAIQGYEPLLDEAWPYTTAILSAARELNIRSSLVTNGTLLAERAAELAELKPVGITVSIDSASDHVHDRLRGVPGALKASLNGISAFQALKATDTRLTVSSVLMPRRRELLEGMPAVLSGLGLDQWQISPLLSIGKDAPGGTVASNAELAMAFRVLTHIAHQNGVNVVLDDELALVNAQAADLRDLLVRQCERPGGLIRLGPDGALSVGHGILRQVDANTPVWQPGIDVPNEFLDWCLQLESANHWKVRVA